MCIRDRAKIGPDKILGVSAHTVEQAKLAEAQGADYLGVGAVFPTGSKDDADEVRYETLKEICQAVNIPVIAIGGITVDNTCLLYTSVGSSISSWRKGTHFYRRGLSDMRINTKFPMAVHILAVIALRCV